MPLEKRQKGFAYKQSHLLLIKKMGTVFGKQARRHSLKRYPSAQLPKTVYNLFLVTKLIGC